SQKSELFESSGCRYRQSTDLFLQPLPKSMSPHSSPQTMFSIEQARSMLPLLRLIVADISLSHRELTERRSNLRRMLRNHQGKSRFHVYDQEIIAIQNDLKEDAAHLDDYISELERLGVVLRSAHDGIVDFPTVIDDQPAFFTWQMDQTDVTDFHWATESTADRRPLEAGSASS
ncbi:MAG: DUF2203 domain-containing protein, partial [Planctomycetota bacterium]